MARHIQSSPATRIENVYINFDPVTVAGISSVAVRVDNSVYQYKLRNSFPASGTDERLDLFALKNIYESSVGILNADGDAVIPEVVVLLILSSYQYTVGSRHISIR